MKLYKSRRMIAWLLAVSMVFPLTSFPSYATDTTPDLQAAVEDIQVTLNPNDGTKEEDGAIFTVLSVEADGTLSSDVIAEMTEIEGAYYPSALEGLTFLGWSTEDDAIARMNLDSLVFTESTTLYGVWTDSPVDSLQFLDAEGEELTEMGCFVGDDPFSLEVVALTTDLEVADNSAVTWNVLSFDPADEEAAQSFALSSEVLTIDESGVITVVGAGVAWVQAISQEDEGVAATLEVTVSKLEQPDFTFGVLVEGEADHTSIEIYSNETLILGATGILGTGDISYALTQAGEYSSYTVLEDTSILFAPNWEAIPDGGAKVEVTATVAEDSAYLSASDRITITILRQDQELPLTLWYETTGGEQGTEDGLLLPTTEQSPATLSLFTQGGAGDGELTYEITQGQDYVTLTGEDNLRTLTPVFTALPSAGNAQVTIEATKAADNLYKVSSDTLTISLQKRVDVTAIDVTPTEANVAKLASFYVGNTATLAASITPEDASFKTVEWFSEDEEIVTVNLTTGVVTAVGKGTTYVYAKATDGTEVVSDRYAITVLQQVTEVKLDITAVDLYVGDTLQLTATVLPEEAENKALTWTSSNDAVATVSASGLITAVGAGTTTTSSTAVITALTVDGGKFATCSVKVTKITQDPLEVWYRYGDTEGTDKVTMYSSEVLELFTEGGSGTGDVSYKANLETYVTITTENGIGTLVPNQSAFASRDSQEIQITATKAMDTVYNVAEDTMIVIINKHVIPDLTVELGELTITANGDSLVEIHTNTLRVSDIADFSVPNITVDDILVEDAVAEVTYTYTDESGEEISLADWTAAQNYLATAYRSVVLTAEYTDVAGNNLSIVLTIKSVSDDHVFVTGITLDKAVGSMEVGQEFPLIATILPEDATDQAVIWSSSNNASATVDENGVVTAIAVGTGSVVITARAAENTNLMQSCTITIAPALIPVTGVTLSEEEVTLVAGGSTKNLVATVSPTSASNKTVFWTSSDETVATVEFTGDTTTGVIKPLEVGTTIITVTTEDGGFTATCELTVTDAPISATGVTLDQSTLNLEVGDTAVLVPTVSPEDASNKNVTWKSSDTSVIVVDATGTVIAISEGSAYVTVTTQDGAFYASCEIIVTGPPVVSVTGISLNKKSVIMEVGGSETLIATFDPEDATDQRLTWSSSDNSVATVDASGKVTAVTLGTVAITVTTADGSYTDSCVISIIIPTIYTVLLDANGGSLSTDSLTTMIDGTLSSLPTPTREHYYFNGWFTAMTGGTQVSTSTVFGSDTIIYAQWTPITASKSYIITLSLNGGTLSANYLATGVFGTLATLPSPTRSGYVFDGWYTTSTGTTRVTTDTVFTADATIYAKWLTGGPVTDSGVTGGITSNSVTQTSNGTATLSPSAPKFTNTVTISTFPNSGYEVASISVVEVGTGLKLVTTDNGNGQYSFIQPSSRVSVLVTYQRSSAIVPGMDGTTVTPQTTTFSDVPTSAWFYDAVTYMERLGLMGGVTGSRFGPYAQTTRGMVVTVLYNLAGRPSASASTQYGDVSAEDWYAGAVAWASSTAVASGIGGGTFLPDGTMNREQLVVMLYGYDKAINGNRYSGSTVLSFVDSSDVSAWAVEATAWCVANGIIGGRTSGAFDPQATATRAEVAVILQNFVEYSFNLS